MRRIFATAGQFKRRSGPNIIFLKKTNNASDFILQVYDTYNERMRKINKFA